MIMPRKSKEGFPTSHDMDARHRGLKQDYVVLQQEHAELKDLLQMTKKRKATLLAEVRFLRCRLKKLKERPSELKEVYAPAPAIRHPDVLPACKSNSKALTRRSPLLSSKNNSIPMLLEPPNRGGSDEFPNVIGDSLGLVSILKTSAISNRAKTNVTTTARKRKIKWQDQISLECN